MIYPKSYDIYLSQAKNLGSLSRLDSLRQRDRGNQRKISTEDTDEKAGHLPDIIQLRGISWRKLRSFVSGVLEDQWGQPHDLDKGAHNTPRLA
ncbi:hypothetical protein EVAR_70904_1 [Eumeta japonica]|uniref:Uncharacterized protein n=1 Tax=Eumeta variegata TaxID=151549 RepID=A0A4C1TA89_EUMVA|nr:hypothetical protein EVAR_70904_1 [Eumeta japonica]